MADLDESDACRVVAFGKVRGAIPALYYQLQAYRPAGSAAQAGDDGAGAVLFIARNGGALLQPIGGWSGGDAWVERPALAHTRQGAIVVLRMSATVSSHPTYDVVLRAIRGEWLQVSDDWSRRVHAPSGTIQSHGTAMDWPTLRASGAFWKPTDPECCPTGGSYIAKLRLVGTRLQLASVRYSAGELSFP